MQAGTNAQAVPRAKQPAATPDQQRVPTYFYIECSVCGRQLRVLVEHLGQGIACRHCGGRLVATDPTLDGHATCSVLEKANQLMVRYSGERPS